MARVKQPGAYIIVHVQSSKVYIGSTSDLHTRRSKHLSALKHGRHKSKNLQAVYDVDQELKFIDFPTADVEKALDEEQMLIDAYPEEFLLNVVRMNVRNTMASLSALGYKRPKEVFEKISASNMGKKLLETTKEKMRQSSAMAVEVSIDGIKYNSFTSAAKALGVKYGTIRWRVSSDKYPTWFETKGK